MLIAQLFSRVFSILLFLPNSNRKTVSAEEDAQEVVKFLALYRAWREEREAVIVETFQALREEDKKVVREFLQVPDETKVIERINPALVGSFQIVYKGQVHAYHSDNSLYKLKEYFIYS